MTQESIVKMREFVAEYSGDTDMTILFEFLDEVERLRAEVEDLRGTIEAYKFNDPDGEGEL